MSSRSLTADSLTTPYLDPVAIERVVAMEDVLVQADPSLFDLPPGTPGSALP